jgi:hypothetical protein
MIVGFCCPYLGIYRFITIRLPAIAVSIAVSISISIFVCILAINLLPTIQSNVVEDE